MRGELTVDWIDEEEDSALSALVSGVPVRDIRTRRNARSVTGHIDSVHCNDRYVFESHGEKRHAEVSDADFAVQRLVAQPCRLQLADGRTYTPDALIVLRSSDRPVFREIKPEKWLIEDPELDGKQRLIANACDALGCDFEIISDAWYNQQPRLRNALWIRRAARHAPADHVAAIADLLTDYGAMTFGQIETHSSLGMHGVFAAFALAGRRFCRLDLNEPFGPDTVFQRSCT